MGEEEPFVWLLPLGKADKILGTAAHPWRLQHRGFIRKYQEMSAKPLFGDAGGYLCFFLSKGSSVCPQPKGMRCQPPSVPLQTSLELNPRVNCVKPQVWAAAKEAEGCEMRSCCSGAGLGWWRAVVWMARDVLHRGAVAVAPAC